MSAKQWHLRNVDKEQAMTTMRKVRRDLQAVIGEAANLPAGFDTPDRRRALAKSVRKEVQAFIDSKVIHGAFAAMAETDPDMRKAYYKASDGAYALLNALDTWIGTK
jgi:hypothetical protein